MHALSIHLPDNLAKESQEAAHELGISRTEFIRKAIIHELEALRKKRELEKIVHSYVVMESYPEYIAESKEIDEGLNSNLPAEKDEWWKK